MPCRAASGTQPCLFLSFCRGPTMPQYQTWEEFSRAAEKLYLADPMKVNRRRTQCLCPSSGSGCLLCRPLGLRSFCSILGGAVCEERRTPREVRLFFLSLLLIRAQ